MYTGQTKSVFEVTKEGAIFCPLHETVFQLDNLSTGDKFLVVESKLDLAEDIFIDRDFVIVSEEWHSGASISEHLHEGGDTFVLWPQCMWPASESIAA